ncbi:hypothetical protein D1AOALGA4SA_693 [Olavius algarvensis Delta 1 endosymbiont]|nr:hypothetical protein D1AOALGA4SA_693 [Olavius algarvensis Delta 1 endosymbiont]
MKTKPFHYSTIPLLRYKHWPQKYHIFSLSCRNFETFIILS